jgi:hypothetical protein
MPTVITVRNWRTVEALARLTAQQKVAPG